MSNIRVRIAPSPSGDLHVGTARTALFNWLYAKKNNGKFVLRIEDTDLERSQEKYVQNIYDSLKAIGLNWDEGPDTGGNFAPYKQSERLEIYSQYAVKLLESGHAYHCYCSQEELEAEKELAVKEKRDFVYSSRCKNISAQDKQKFLEENRQPVIRFSMPDMELKFNDLIKGEIKFDTSLTGDFVIMKSNGMPTYNFAVVVDDVEMRISHVIRGEDHISNTPRQILIYRALGVELPKFAHLGMILAPDKTKLSKRHGATAVSEFINQGYLPEAFVNFLALLGWSPADGEEIKSIEDIIQMFEFDRVSSTPAVFEFDKLNWMNGVYIRNLPIEDLSQRVMIYLEKYDLSAYSQDKIRIMVEAVRNNLVKLTEITDSLSYFFDEFFEVDDEMLETIIKIPEGQQVLSEFKEFCSKINYESIEQIHDQLGEFREQMKPLKPKQVMPPLRAALTGRKHGADLASIIYVLGNDRVKKRIQIS